MTQLEAYADFIRSHGYSLYLKDILTVHIFRAEYRKLNIFLRDKLGWKYSVKQVRGDSGMNHYVFTEPAKITIDQNGQRAFA